MWILLIPLAILSVIAVTGGFLAAGFANRMRLDRRGELVLFGLLLGCGLLPSLWHYQMTIDFASSYGAYHPDEPVGFYPGLRRFQIAAPIGGLLLWSAGCLIARWLPLLSAGLPGVAFLAYYRALRWVGEDPPGVMLDNKATIFLFILDTAAVLGLATYAVAIWAWPWRQGKAGKKQL